MGDCKAAEKLHREAEKKAKNTGGFFGLFSGNQGLEDAVELYVKAANSYKVAKSFKNGGDCFCCAAKLNVKLDFHIEAASNYVDAGNTYKKSYPKEAIDSYLKAIDIYLDNGRFLMAAKQQLTIAELYETDLRDITQAEKAYQQAADWFAGEDATSQASKALLKVAEFKAIHGDYAGASEIFEKLGQEAMASKLLKWGAREYFLKAGLLLFCYEEDLVVEKKIHGYVDSCPVFKDSRESRFLIDILECSKVGDMNGFSKIVEEYDKITHLDAWMTTILLHIKNGMDQVSAAL